MARHRRLLVMALPLVLVGAWLAVRAAEPQIEASCSVNGFGTGACTFTNRGFVPDAACGTAELKNALTGEKNHSAAFCSGYLWPSSSVQISFFVPNVVAMCRDREHEKWDWDDVCALKFVRE